MSGVVSVSAVSSSSRSEFASRVTVQAVPVNSAPAVKATRSVSPTHNAPAAQSMPSRASAPVITQSNLPLGLLLTVRQPTANNVQAGEDYQNLQNDLRSGNLSAAQQAYLRLQTDLLMTNSAATTASNGGALNATA
jgi:hypothetical protein